MNIFITNFKLFYLSAICCLLLLSCGEDISQSAREQSYSSGSIVAPLEGSMDALPAEESIYLSIPFSEPHGGTVLYIPFDSYPAGALIGETFAIDHYRLNADLYLEGFSYFFRTNDLPEIRNNILGVLVKSSLEQKPIDYFQLMFEIPKDSDPERFAILYDVYTHNDDGEEVRHMGVLPFSSRRINRVDSKLVIDIWRYGFYNLIELEESISDEIVMRTYLEPEWRN